MVKSEVAVSPFHLNDKVIVPDLMSFGDENFPYQLFPSHHMLQ